MVNSKRIFITVMLALFISSAGSTIFGIDLYFENDAHDPSTIHKDGDTYWFFCTGDGIQVRYSADLLSWQHADDPVFPYGTWPSWINDYVTNFAGNFWAPDVIMMNDKYYLYYSCFATIGDDFESAIGVAVSDSLNDPDWQDLGMVVSSNTEPKTSPGNLSVNCIDPGLFRDASGNVWMTFGSYSGGIFVVQINPETGKRMNSNRYAVAGNGGYWSGYEGSQATYINGYYYLFANLGQCCQGSSSTYYIVVGRSTSPTGPYLDKNGVNLWYEGGSTVLSTSGKYIGPGHYGYYNNDGQNLVSIHYYDGDSTHGDGWPARLDLLEMSFSNNWPVLTRNFTISGASAPTPVTAGLTDGATRRIHIRHSGKVLDVTRIGGTPQGSNGTNVLQWTNLKDDTQKWVFNKITEPVDGDYYWSIHPAHATTKAIDVVSFGVTDGTNAMLWDYWGGNCQQWRFVDVGDGWYQLVPRHSSRRLHIHNGSTADGANAEQWRSNETWYHQHFRFYGCEDVDIYRDGLIDFKDYCILAADWLDQGPGLSGDITGNDIVDMVDLKVLLLYWGQTCE